MMNRYGIDAIKKRFNFSQWSDFSNLKQDLYIWNYFLTGQEFPGLQIKHNQKVSLPGWPPSYQSIWSPSGNKQDTMLRCDVYECSSRMSAHEFMVYLLKEFQLPLIGQKKLNEIGDVSFFGKKNSVIIFARANLVFMVSNIGKVFMPIFELLYLYDRNLCSKPEINETCDSDFEICNFKTLSPSLNNREQVLLELAVRDTKSTKKSLNVESSNQSDIALYFKFFSTNGQVSMEYGQFVCKPAFRGNNELAIYAVDKQQRVASSIYDFGYE